MGCLVASYVMETKMVSNFRFANDTTEAARKNLPHQSSKCGVTLGLEFDLSKTKLIVADCGSQL